MAFKTIQDGNFLLSNDDYCDMQEAICNISNYLEIIDDYCEQNADNCKIYPLLMVIEHLKIEKKRITSKF